MHHEMTNRQKAALETRKKIIEAARQVISEKGFENVSIEDITNAAGTSTGSFYTYFKRKEEVIEELNCTDFYLLAQSVNAMKDRTILERLQIYCGSFLKSIERCGIEICRQWTRNNIAPTPMCSCGESITKYAYDYQAMQSILGQAVADGQLTDETPVDKLALLINSQLYGLMVAWCMSDGKVIGSEETDSYIELFIKSALAPYLKG